MKLVASFFIGVSLWLSYLIVTTNTHIVYKPATDEQLLNFWFSPQTNKAAVRRRICGR